CATSSRLSPGVRLLPTTGSPNCFRTDWAGRSMVHGEVMDAYADTPLGQMRQFHASFTPVGDPQKMANAIITLTNMETAPLRLALGSDIYTLLKAKPPQRLEQLEAHKDLTLSTD